MRQRACCRRLFQPTSRRRRHPSCPAPCSFACSRRMTKAHRPGHDGSRDSAQTCCRSAHRLPTSASSRNTVSLDLPQIRVVLLMLLPSVRHRRIDVLSCTLSFFIPSLYMLVQVRQQKYLPWKEFSCLGKYAVYNPRRKEST